jgi:hypothetical protein
MTRFVLCLVAVSLAGQDVSLAGLEREVPVCLAKPSTL